MTSDGKKSRLELLPPESVSGSNISPLTKSFLTTPYPGNPMCNTSLKTAKGTSSALFMPVEPHGARKVSFTMSNRANPMSRVAMYAISP